jgi:DNA-binding CsgD family transcriptional regulator
MKQKLRIMTEKINENHTRYHKYYITLSALNYSDRDIQEFLEIDKGKLMRIKKSIRQKFHTNDEIQMILKASKTRCFNRYDLLEDSAKINAANLTKTTFMLLKTNKLDYFTTKRLLQEHLKSCIEPYMQLYSSYSEAKTMTPTEIQFVFMKAQGNTIKAVSEKTGIGRQTLQHLKIDIFYKMDAKNWFNVFRKAFKFGIIEDYFLQLGEKTFYEKLKYDKTIETTLQLLKLTETKTHNSNAVLKLKIYEILAFYIVDFELEILKRYAALNAFATP